MQLFHIKIVQNHSTSFLQAPQNSACKIMRVPTLWLAWDLLKVKLFLTLPPVSSMYIFPTYWVQAMFQRLSDLAWRIQTFVTADTFKESILQRFAGAKGNLLLKNRNSIPLEFKKTLVIPLYDTHFAFFVFLTSVGFTFSSLLTKLAIIPTVSELQVKTEAACEIWLLYVKHIHASYI